MSFVAFLESEIKLKRDLCEPNTHKKRITQLNKLKRFAPAAKLSEINVAWIERYHGWWKREGANPTTINKALSLLRTFMNWAIKKDLIKKNPFDDYVIKGYTPERRVLSKFEVTRLMECYRSGELTPAQKETLRHFLFACFTGLRYSDIENLTTNNIIENSLHIRQKKTTEPLIIPIGEQAKSFLSSIQGDKPFIVSSNQKTNKVLHRVALKAKLRPFTYHSARHTFATMGIEFGVPVPTMQNLLGHADIQTTMQYVHIAQRMKQQAISTIDSYFQK
jgi:site-specific recombinase XerD